jgi:hypothetical protein
VNAVVRPVHLFVEVRNEAGEGEKGEKGEKGGGGGGTLTSMSRNPPSET